MKLLAKVFRIIQIVLISAYDGISNILELVDLLMVPIYLIFVVYQFFANFYIEDNLRKDLLYKYRDSGLIDLRAGLRKAKNIAYIVNFSICFVFNTIVYLYFKKQRTVIKKRRGSFFAKVFGDTLSINAIFKFRLTGFFCKIAILAVCGFLEGIIVTPFILAMLIIFFTEIISISNQARFMIWAWLVKALRLFNFMALFFILIINSNYVVDHIPFKTKRMIGDMTMTKLYDIFRVGILFLLQALLSYHDHRILILYNQQGALSNEDLGMSKFVLVNESDELNETWYVKIFRHFLRIIINYSYKIIQLMLILWGLSRVSIILFCFVVCGIVGVQVEDRFFGRYMIKILLMLGFFFVAVQSVYNISSDENFWGEDKYFKRATLRQIGFYKYKYMHAPIKTLKDLKLGAKEAQFKRCVGMILDLLSFYFLTISSVLLSLRDAQMEKNAEREFEIGTLEFGRRRSLTSKIESKEDTKDAKMHIYRKIVTKLFNIWVQHSFKLCVTLMLFASILVTVDLIHLVYLIFFMVLMGLNFSKLTRYRIFYTIIIYSGCAILGLYFYQVLGIYLPKDFEKLTGLTHDKVNLIYLYKEHVLIFFTYLLCYKDSNIPSTPLEKRQKLTIKALEEGLEELDLEKKTQKSASSLKTDQKIKENMDSIKIFFVRNLVWIHYFAVVFVLFLPPLNFFSFVYINWLYLLIGVMIVSPSQIFKSKWMKALTGVFSGYSAVILLLRYITQISSNFVKGYLKSTFLFSESDFGLSQKYMTMVLLGNSVLFLLFSFHRKEIQKGRVSKQLDFLDKKKKSHVPIPKTFDFYRYSLVVWFMQARYILNPIFYITIVFGCSLMLCNFIGLFYFILLIIGIIREKKRQWSQIWISPFIVSVTVMTIQYLINCIDTIHTNKYRYLLKWIGWEFEGRALIKNYFVFLLIITYSIFFTSKGSGSHLILDKRNLEALAVDRFYHIKQEYSFYRAYIIYRSYGNEFAIKKIEEKKRDEKLKKIDDAIELVKEKERGNDQMLISENNLYESESDSVFDDPEIQEEIKERIIGEEKKIEAYRAKKEKVNTDYEMLINSEEFKHKLLLVTKNKFKVKKYEKDLDLYVLKKPVIKGNFFYHRIMKTLNFFIIELGIFFLAISVFFAGNAVSLINFAIAVYFSRKVHHFYKAQKNRHELRRFYIQWKVVIVYLAIVMIVKYFFMIWLPSIWNGKYPFDRLKFNCDEKYRNTFSKMPGFKKHSDYFKCIFEWKKWSLIYSRNKIDIMWDFFAFFIMLGSLKAQERLIHIAVMGQKEKKLTEADDFTNTKNRQGFIQLFKFVFFSYLSSLSLFVFFVIGIIGNSSNTAGDIFSIIYMTVGVRHLLKGTIYSDKKKETWKTLEYFNISVMALQILFQIPYFPCPVIVSKKRYFISTEECEATYQTGVPILNFKESKSPLQIVYAILVNTFGLEKVYANPVLDHSKILFMIIFFFLAMLQRHVWDHRYYKKFVDEHFKNQDFTSFDRAKVFIRHFYEQKIWKYMYIRTEYEVLRRRQGRIDKKIQRWKGLLDERNNSRRKKGDDEVSATKTEYGESQDEIEKRQILAEKMALDYKNAPHIELARIEQILKINSNDRDKSEKVIQSEQQAVSDLVNRKMHLVKVINLPPLRKKAEIFDRIPSQILGKTASVYNLETLMGSGNLKKRKSRKESLIPPSQFGSKRIKRSPRNSIDSELEKGINLEESSVFDDSFKKFSPSPNLGVHKKKTSADALGFSDIKKSKQEAQVEKSLLRFQTLGSPFKARNPLALHRSRQNSVASDEDPLLKILPMIENNPNIRQRKKDPNDLGSMKELDDQKQSKYILMLKSILLNMIHPGIKYNKSKVVLSEESTLLSLIESTLRSYTIYFVCIFFFLNHYNYANLLSLALPLSLFLYALLENPFPVKFYWLFMANYLFGIILLKMIYQLPIFCGDPPFTLAFSKQCKFDEVSRASFYRRWDIIIGIRKFNGNASYPREEGIFHGLIFDYLALVSILIHRACLSSMGLWENVTLSKDRRLFPQLKRKGKNGKRNKSRIMNKSRTLRRSDYGGSLVESVKDTRNNPSIAYRYEEEDNDINKLRFEIVNLIKTRLRKLKRSTKTLYRELTAFFYRLFPYYLNYKYEASSIHYLEKFKYEPLFIKPGKDLYTATFVLELIILLFFILCYSNLNGNSISFKEGLTRSRFSGNLVIVIMSFIFLLCMNRICFKLKYSNFNNEYNYKLKKARMEFKKEGRNILGGAEEDTMSLVSNFSPSLKSRAGRKSKKKPKQEFRVNHVDENSKYRIHALTARFIIYVITVIMSHYYLFFLVPRYHKRVFSELGTAKLCYLLCLTYFFVCAKQISHGYGDSIKIHAFTDQFNVFGKLGVRVFKAIPFLYEIKNVID